MFYETLGFFFNKNLCASKSYISEVIQKPISFEQVISKLSKQEKCICDI